MSSVQERLQLKRVALDKWSTREKLCLAAAVACSGDQNWMSVSRSLRLLCGTTRPSDWFSQKSCAVQYGELLENADHPKRKKRTSSERDSQTAETPTESILRKLTEERIAELEDVIVKTRKDCVKLKEDIMLIQSSNVTEAQLREMWAQCEKEDEEKRAEQQKYNQWLKEREERKTELQKSWRPGNFQTHPHLQQQQQHQKFLQSQRGQSSGTHQQQDHVQQQAPQVKPLQLNISQKSEEMEIEDSPVASSKPSTSPLLTSLLKSTSPAPTSVANMSTNVRITAPTITNLLTGGSATSQVQSQTSSPSHQQKPYLSLNLKPLTGPSPIVEHPPQAAPSPSQAAPTLSMLLENKNKEVTATVNSRETSSPLEDVKAPAPTSNEPNETEEENGSPSKDDEQLMEVFKGLIPDNIEELADILTNNNAIILNPELLEEESILDGVESLIDEQEQEQQHETKKNSSVKEESSIVTEEEQNKIRENKASKNPENKEEKPNVQEKIKVEKEESNETSQEMRDMRIFSKPNDTNIQKPNTKIESEKKNIDSTQHTENLRDPSDEKTVIKEEKDIKVEKVESSDDSSDNTTLQVLREKIQVDNKIETSDELDEKLEVSDEEVVMEIHSAKEEDEKDERDEKESASENEGNKVDLEEEKETAKVPAKEDSPPVIIVTEAKTQEAPEESQKSLSESSDIIIIAEDDDSNETESDRVKEQLQTKKLETAKSPKEEIEARKTPVSEQNQLTPKDNTTSKDTLSPSSPKVTKMETETTNSSSNNTTSTTTAGNNANVPNMETTTITIIDTDEESPVEVIKEDKSSKSKRDYSRKRIDHSVEKKDESSILNPMNNSGPTATSSISTPSNVSTNEESKQALSIRRLRDRDGSESPLVDDDNVDVIPRTRRRYSSTPIIDSIPSSPASSDDREYKAWKKSILMIYNRIAIHKHASLFLKPITEDMAPNYKNIVLRSMDLYTIKKNIENGNIRTTVEFQRDIMLMCQNAIMYNKRDNNLATMAKEMMTESMNIIETLTESIGKREQEKILSSSASTSSSGVKSRTSRKSTRLP